MLIVLYSVNGNSLDLTALQYCVPYSVEEIAKRDTVLLSLLGILYSAEVDAIIIFLSQMQLVLGSSDVC